MEAESIVTKLGGGASSPAGSGTGGSHHHHQPTMMGSNGVFSPSAFLPPARRCWSGQFNNNNNGTTAEDAAAVCSGFSAVLTAGAFQQQQRKRPCCHPQFPAEQEDYEDATCQGEPLDLSLPKFKVRQHWSGGSIVHESTFSLPNQCACPGSLSSEGGSTVARFCPTSFNVSVTVQTPERWLLDQQQQQQQQQLRLRIDIPKVAEAPQQQLHQNNRHHNHLRHRKSVPLETMAADPYAAVPNTAEDDLQRLADSQRQLRLSGFYYGHLSWKESVHLLQNTPVGTFLLRDSSDARYLYALSLQTDRGPTSVRIHYSSRGFRLDAATGQAGLVEHLPRFRSVLHLVDHYVAKWSHCRDKGQFWLDNTGQVHSEVVLTRPLIRTVPTLQHLSRLAWNNREPSNRPAEPEMQLAVLPPTIRTYLKDYPFQH